MVASEQHLYQTIELPRKLATGSIHDYRILFEVMKIMLLVYGSNKISLKKTKTKNIRFICVSKYIHLVSL